MSQAQDASVPASAAADSIFADKSRHHWSLSLYDAPQPAPDALTNDQEQLNPRQAYMSLHKERLADFKAAHPGAVQFGGPMYDEKTGKPVGSVLLLQRHPDVFPERQDVERWVDQDPYWQNKVWARREINLFVALTTPSKSL